MAAVTGTVLAGGMAAYQIAQSEKQKKDAQRELNDYDRQTLDNAFKDIQINTAGSDLLREQGAQTTANMVDAAQNGGTRAIIGSLPKIGAYTNQIDREAARLLDDQYTRRDYAAANDNARIEGITENRDNANINALSSQIQAGKQGVWDGIMGAASAAAYGMKSYQPGENPQVDSVGGQVQPLGIQPMGTQPIQATQPTSFPAVGTNSAPLQNPSPYFDFGNSYTPATPAGGTNQHNPFFNFPTSYNGF